MNIGEPVSGEAASDEAAVVEDPVAGQPAVEQSAVEQSAVEGGPVASVPRGHHQIPVLTYAGLLVGGLVLGLIAVVVYAERRVVGDRSLPWGLALVIIAVPTCVRGAAWLVGSRRGAVVVALGWLLPTLTFSVQGPGGDVLLPAGWRTNWYLGAAGLLVLLAVLLPLPRGAGLLASERRDVANSRSRAEPVEDG
jgi:hypothetical protein